MVDYRNIKGVVVGEELDYDYTMLESSLVYYEPPTSCSEALPTTASTKVSNSDLRERPPTPLCFYLFCYI